MYRAVRCLNTFIQHYTRPRPQSYHNSCQLMSILCRKKLFMIDVAIPTDFLCLHEAFVNPTYVLKRNVSLYCLSKEEAVFVETPEAIDIYSSTVSPFQYIGQFQHAPKVLQMPISSFHQLADKVGKPRIPVGYMANTGRCGSTILAQALERVPEMLVHAEPDSLTNICLMKKDQSISNSEREKLLVSTIKIVCKPIDGVSSICIKTRSCASSHILTIAKEFPDIRIMFGYRDSMATVSSFLGLMISETVQSLSLYVIDSDVFSKLVPFFRRKLHHYFVRALDFQHPLVLCEDMNSVELFAYKWACCMTLARDLKNNGGNMLPILYEDLVGEPREQCKKVFNILGVDHKHLEAAVEAFKNDSQESTVLSRKNTQNYNRRKISDECRLRADKILLKFGLPGLGQEYHL